MFFQSPQKKKYPFIKDKKVSGGTQFFSDKPNLPDGWLVDTSGNYHTDQGWVISSDQSKFTDPIGKEYTKEDIQRSDQMQKDLSTLFPETDIKELSDHAEKDPQQFIAHFQQIGDTPLSRSVLKSMGLQDADINQIFKPYGPELPQGYELNDQGKMIQNAALPGKPDSWGINPFRQGGPWEGDQAMSTVDIHNPLSMAAVAVPMELMAGRIPLALIGAAADVLGPGWQTAMGIAGMDTSAAVAPDYLGKIATAVMSKLGGSAEKTAAKFIEAGLARGAKMDEIAKSLTYIKGLKPEMIEKLTGIIPEGKIPGAGLAGQGAKTSTPILDKLNRASAALGEASVSTKGKWQQRIRTFQEQVFDKYYGMNRAGGRTLTPGTTSKVGRLFLSDVEQRLAVLSGAAQKGQQRAKDVYTGIKSALGEVDEQYVSAYLKLIHNQDILAAHPDRKITGGLLGQMELQQGLRELQVILGPEGYAKVVQAGKTLTDHWAGMLYEMVESGLVSQETADLLRQMYPHYNPTKYIERLIAEKGGAGRGASVVANDIKSLSEEGSEAMTANPMNVLLMDTIKKQALIDRNNAAKAIAEMVANNAEIAAEVADGSIFYMKNGEKITLAVPKWLEKEAKLMGSEVTGAAGGTMRLADAINQVSRLGMTGINIAFFVPNFAVDCLTVCMTSGVGPLMVGESLARNLKGIFKQDEWVRRYNLAGGGMSGFSGKSIREIIHEAEKGGNIALRDAASWRRLLNPITFIEEIGHAVEMAPRVAAFRKGIQEGMTDMGAAVKGRRATVDFSRSGVALQYLNHFYLFLNAGVQGSVLPFRMLKNDPRSRLRLALFMGATVGLYQYNQSYPEYADVPDYVKYGSLHIMLPSDKYDANGLKVPRYICIVPNSREWGMFHGSLQYLLANLQQKDPGNFAQFFSAWFPNINPLSKYTGGGTGLMPTQLGSTLIDVSLNNDSFRMKPIVPAYMLKLPKPEQYDQYSSETAVKLGALLNESPKKIDYFITNVFGGVGSQILDTIDWAIKALDDEQPDFKIQRLTEQLKAIQSGVPGEMKGADPQQIGQEIVRRRTEFLNALTPEERKIVLKAEGQPEPRIPLITTIIGRVYRERGGQLKENATGELTKEKEAAKQADAQAGTPDDLKKAEADYIQAIEDFNAGKVDLDYMEKTREKYRSFKSGYQSATYKDNLYPSGAELRTELGTEPPEAQAVSEYYKLMDEQARSNRLALAQTGSSALYDRLEKQVLKEIADKWGQEAADYVVAHKSDYLSNQEPTIAQFEKLRNSELEQGTWYVRARQQGKGMQSATPAEIARLYKQYTALRTTKQKNALRKMNPALDEWLREMGYAALKEPKEKSTYSSRQAKYQRLTAKQYTARFRGANRRTPSKRMVIRKRKPTDPISPTDFTIK